MKNFSASCKQLYREFITRLRQIEHDEPDYSECYGAAIAVCGDYIQQLRELVVKHEFEDTAQQINFFKNVKPAFTSEAIYYTDLFNLQLKWPAGSMEAQKEYLNNASQRITRFYYDHQSFYEYHRAKHTHLDAQYFVRGRPDWRLYTDPQLVFADPVFCTPCDQKLATLLAYKRLQHYIQETQKCLLQGITIAKSSPARINFSGTNTEAVELIYLLRESKRFNNGKATVNDFVQLFEVHFSFVVKEPYKILGEMRMRKGSQAKFTDYMRDELLKFMNGDDESS